jgi:hypothetical protein
MDQKQQLEHRGSRSRRERNEQIIGWIACAVTMPLAVAVYAMIYLGGWRHDLWYCITSGEFLGCEFPQSQ